MLVTAACAMAQSSSPFGARRRSHNKSKSSFQSLQTIYPHDEVGEHRYLQSDEEVCAFIIDELVDGSYAQFCSCDRVGDSYVLDCVYTDCPDCELLQGSEEETCAISNDGVVLSLSEDLDLLADIFFSCTLYESGLFDSTAVCLIEEFTGEFCAFTVDEQD
jgi:hypothetical protein